jgi:hypothetical protein
VILINPQNSITHPVKTEDEKIISYIHETETNKHSWVRIILRAVSEISGYTLEWVRKS